MGLIKKIIFTLLILYGAFIFYKKFMASTFEPFFKEKSGKVDLLQMRSPTIDKLKQ